MTDTREEYKRWVFEGNCPCCFPYWEYDIRVSESDVWEWQDEFRAWDVYGEIMREAEDERAVKSNVATVSQARRWWERKRR